MANQAARKNNVNLRLCTRPKRLVSWLHKRADPPSRLRRDRGPIVHCVLHIRDISTQEKPKNIKHMQT